MTTKSFTHTASTRLVLDRGKERSATTIFLLLSATLSGFSPEKALAKPSTGSTESKSIDSALNVAKNAFEFRDFKKVIEILDPWVHPPRISDPKLMSEARRLLGISYHLVGNEKQAAEEFAQLLLLTPNIKLDPFVVPPAVIQTFDSVRKKLVPPSETLIQEPEKPPPTQLVQVVPHPSVSLLPFGYAQLAVLENQEAWGWTWLTTQLIGVALNIGGFWAANSLRETNGVPITQQARFDAYVIGMYAGAGIFSAGYIGSSIQAYRALSESPNLDDPLRIPAESTPPPGNSQFSIPILQGDW